MRARLIISILLASACAAFGQGYSTTFSGGNESPLRESGRWLDGGADGGPWHDMTISSGIAYGPGGFNTEDSVAALTGTWGTNQFVSLKIHVTDQSSSGGASPEIEVHLLDAITSGNLRGYEINYSARTNGGSIGSGGRYLVPVRWNGPDGNFTSLGPAATSSSGLPALKEDDIITAGVFHRMFYIYINGVEYYRTNDNIGGTSWSSGAPGMGTDQSDTKNGFKSFTAITWNSGTKWYLRIDGNDNNSGLVEGSGGSFRSWSKATSVAVAGDTVDVGMGAYGELVTTVADGTPSAPILFISNPTNTTQPTIKEFRSTRQNNAIVGIKVTGGGDSLNNALVRVEPPGGVNNGSGFRMTNCVIDHNPLVVTTNAWFGSNFVAITTAAKEGGDFNQAGFTVGSRVFLGGDSVRAYTNIGRAMIVQSISGDGKTMTFTANLPDGADSGTNYFAVIGAGGDNSFSRGLLIQLGGGIGASNVVVDSCLFTNTFGPVIVSEGPNNTFVNNTITDGHGFYFLQFQGPNLVFSNNFVPRNRNIENWRPTELNDAGLHGLGGRLFDYQSSDMGSFNDTGCTNAYIGHNWFQDCANQGGQFENVSGSYGVLFEYNVLVGILMHGSMSRNFVTNNHNTFLRCAFNIEETLSYGYGGVGGDIQSNCAFTANLWVNTGEHANPPNEHPYTLTSYTNFIETNNLSLTCETMDWSNTPAQSGMITNAGDPIFVDISHPLGLDGIPFTADDGLRPLTNSIVALRGIGALAPIAFVSQHPQAHFTAKLAAPGWKDATGTNYDPVWTAQTPDQRPGPIRPWQTPEAVGAIPVTVAFDASGSIGGLQINDIGIWFFVWSFGDGTVQKTFLPAASHTYTTAGSNWVVLVLTNVYGFSSTYSNCYRTLPATGSALRYVSITGNDSTGDGLSTNTAWRTIQKSADGATAGWVVSVGPGDYDEIVNCTVSVASPINFISRGATTHGWNLRNSNYRGEGWWLKGAAMPNGAAIYCYAGTSNILFQGNHIGPFTNSTFGVYTQPGTAATPLTSSSWLTISNTWLDQVDYIQINTYGLSNVFQGNIESGGNGQADYFRPWGQGTTIRQNLMTGVSLITENHTDFIQVFGPEAAALGRSVVPTDYVVSQDILVEGNVVINSRATFATMQNYQDPVGYITNFAIRNNIVRDTPYQSNISVDGTKWYNDLFWRVGFDVFTPAFVFAGTSGSAWGTSIRNCIFKDIGNATNTLPYPRVNFAETNWSINADYDFVCNYTNGPVPAGSSSWGADGQETHGINGGDPKLVSIANNDYHIASGSPLIGVAQVQSSFTTDAEAQTRNSTNWDIGPLAFSFGTQGGGGGGADPAITIQPSGQTVCATQNALFTITATGNTSLSYQWKTNGVNAGTNGPALALLNCPAAWSGMTVICRVTDTAGFVDSSTVTLTVNPDPVINTQPQNQTVVVGQTATFTVSASSCASLANHFQWTFNGSNVGTDGSTYARANCQISDSGGLLQVTVSNTAGSPISNTATLTVNAAAPPGTHVTGTVQRGSLNFGGKRRK